MGYFAQIDDNGIVQQVISISNDVLNEPEFTFPETEPIGRVFISKTLGLPGEWRQTSFNGNFRGRYAGIGFRYDPERDQFIAPQPYPSWSLDSEGNWVPPIPQPNDGFNYHWNEENQTWDVMLRAE